MKLSKKALIGASAALLLGLPFSAVAHKKDDGKKSDPWFQAGREALEKEKHRPWNMPYAKNVILFVGDGMGVSTVTAARILEGQLRGETGEENSLSFEEFPYLALSKTYNTNAQTPDSAGTMTAMVTGVKTKQGVLSADDSVVRGDHTTVNPVKTLVEEAEERGLATGVVTTARLTHATPAACYAHSADRNWEDDSSLPEAAAQDDFPDIARQLIEFSYGDGIDVAMGGGRRHFLPEADGGRRTDGRDLPTEWVNQYPNAAYVTNQAEFDAIDANDTEHLLGLFESSHMEYEADRADDVAEEGGEPSLAEMTAKAIDILDNNEKGFFLHVESGRIDHAHHAGNASRSLQDTIAFAEAVAAAVDATDPKETLIVVTADHSHVFTIGGYPIRGNDILGKVVGVNGELALASDGQPYTTLAYGNGPGFVEGPRPDLSDVNTADLDYLQQAAVPLGSETHSAEEVAIYAQGPSAHLFRGTKEQNYIYHVMANALRLHRRRGHRRHWGF